MGSSETTKTGHALWLELTWLVLAAAPPLWCAIDWVRPQSVRVRFAARAWNANERLVRSYLREARSLGARVHVDSPRDGAEVHEVFIDVPRQNHRVWVNRCCASALDIAAEEGYGRSFRSTTRRVNVVEQSRAISEQLLQGHRNLFEYENGSASNQRDEYWRDFQSNGWLYSKIVDKRLGL